MITSRKKIRFHPVADGIIRYGTALSLSWYGSGIVKMLTAAEGTYSSELFSVCIEYCAVCCSVVFLLGIFCDAVMRFD